MDHALEAESPQIVGHLSAGVGMTEERFDRVPQVVVAKAVRQMGEGAERLERPLRGGPSTRVDAAPTTTTSCAPSVARSGATIVTG